MGFDSIHSKSTAKSEARTHHSMEHKTSTEQQVPAWSGTVQEEWELNYW